MSKTITVGFPTRAKEITISDGGANEVTKVIFAGRVARLISITSGGEYRMSEKGVDGAAAFDATESFPVRVGTLELAIPGWGDEGPV